MVIVYKNISTILVDIFGQCLLIQDIKTKKFMFPAGKLKILIKSLKIPHLL